MQLHFRSDDEEKEGIWRTIQPVARSKQYLGFIVFNLFVG